MSDDLEYVHTMPELLEWLKMRLRWVRDWHKTPGMISPAFRDAIIAMFRPIAIHKYPSNPAEVEQWALEHVWLFSVITIHHVHDWLETHNIYGAPEWRTPDLTKEEYARNNPVEVDHLSALLNFIGVRAGERSAPDVRSEGVRPEGEDRDRKKRRGRPADTDQQRDKRIGDAWKTRRYKTYEELAGALKMSKRDVKQAIDRERKRRNK